MKEILPFIKSFTPSIIDSEKMSHELLTPPMTLPKSNFLIFKINS